MQIPGNKNVNDAKVMTSVARCRQVSKPKTSLFPDQTNAPHKAEIAFRGQDPVISDAPTGGIPGNYNGKGGS